MSAECFERLYGKDELEDGEVDVRLNSFRACAALRLRDSQRGSQSRDDADGET